MNFSCHLLKGSLLVQISEMKLTFKEIIGNYRKQPHCKPQVFRSVFIDWSHSKLNGVTTLMACWFHVIVAFCQKFFLRTIPLGKQKSGQDHVDVITFYNEIFIPSVKPLLVELGPATANFRTINDPEGKNSSAVTISFLCQSIVSFTVQRKLYVDILITLFFKVNVQSLPGYHPSHPYLIFLPRKSRPRTMYMFLLCDHLR